jgi:hypothetical protein
LIIAEHAARSVSARFAPSSLLYVVELVLVLNIAETLLVLNIAETLLVLNIAETLLILNIAETLLDQMIIHASKSRQKNCTIFTVAELIKSHID